MTHIWNCLPLTYLFLFVEISNTLITLFFKSHMQVKVHYDLPFPFHLIKHVVYFSTGWANLLSQ